MSIRIKSLLAMAWVVCGVMAITVAAAYLIVMRGFTELEHQQMHAHLRRAVAVVHTDLADLNSTLGDWAPWDDTYRFIADGNAAYIADNLNDSTLINLGVSLIVYVRPTGGVRYAKRVDVQHKQAVRVPREVYTRLATDRRLVGQAGRRTGIVLLEGRPMLVATQPILHSDFTGPANGTLLMGREITAAEVRRYSERIQLPLHIAVHDQTRRPADWRRHVSVKRGAQNMLLGSTPLAGLDGRPLLLLRVSAPRTIYAQGLRTTRYFVFALGIAGFAFCGLLALVLQRVVLRRLFALHREVRRVRESSDLTERISLPPGGQPDELDGLTRAINQMLSTLDEVHRAIVEQETIRESEERYRALVESSPYAVFLLAGTRCLFTNAAGYALLGLDASDARLAAEGVMPFVPDDARAHWETLLAAGANAPMPGQEVPLLHRDGQTIIVEAVIRPFVYQGRPCVQMIAHDITARKAAEEAIREYQARLRALSMTLTTAEEAERRRIAADLHDSVGQTLVVARLLLGTLKDSGVSAPVQSQVEEIRTILEQGIEWTRSLTIDLSPPILTEQGLGKALEWFCKRTAEQHGVSISVAQDGEEAPLPIDLRSFLYRALRELVLNVVKHAQASRATVALTWADGMLVAVVADDGVGMPCPVGAQDARGFGLFSVQERLRHLGGDLAYTSAPGQGTRVTLTVPLGAHAVMAGAKG